MRELARCLAWTFALGALALLLAMFHGAGIEHADGPLAWLLVAMYWPHYLLGQGQGAWPEPVHLPAVLAAQFAYFLAVVVALRRLRGKSRWRIQRRTQ